MSHYKSNLRDIEFNLFEVLGRDEILGTGPFAESTARPPARSSPRSTGSPARTSPRRTRTATATRRSSTRRPAPRRCPSRSRRATRPGWTPSTGGCRSPRSSAAQPAPSTLNWAIAEMVLGANAPIWMYAAGPAFAGVIAPQRQRARPADRPAHGRARLGHHDGADRARRRLRRRRRPRQGDCQRRRLLEHRGRQALHHLGRARPAGEHHPPGARPPGRRRGRRRPGHQGPQPVHRAEVPLRPRDRRADRRAQRRLRHQRRAQDGHQGVQHLRAHLRRPRRRRRRAGQGLAARRGARRHRADVPGHRERPDDGRHQGHRHPVDRLPQRARVRQGARAGRRPHPGRRQDRAARDDHPPPRRTPLADDAEVVRRGDARAGALHRDAGRTR